MKFETGLEQQDRDKDESSGKKLGWFQKYKSWNWKNVPALLEIRKKNLGIEEERMKARIEELKKREERGDLWTKL